MKYGIFLLYISQVLYTTIFKIVEIFISRCRCDARKHKNAQTNVSNYIKGFEGILCMKFKDILNTLTAQRHLLTKNVNYFSITTGKIYKIQDKYATYFKFIFIILLNY